MFDDAESFHLRGIDREESFALQLPTGLLRKTACYHSERSEEWSERDERHGRLSSEGSCERVGRRASSISFLQPNGLPFQRLRSRASAEALLRSRA